MHIVMSSSNKIQADSISAIDFAAWRCPLYSGLSEAVAVYREVKVDS